MCAQVSTKGLLGSYNLFYPLKREANATNALNVVAGMDVEQKALRSDGANAEVRERSAVLAKWISHKAARAEPYSAGWQRNRTHRRENQETVLSRRRCVHVVVTSQCYTEGVCQWSKAIGEGKSTEDTPNSIRTRVSGITTLLSSFVKTCWECWVDWLELPMMSNVSWHFWYCLNDPARYRPGQRLFLWPKTKCWIPLFEQELLSFLICQ